MADDNCLYQLLTDDIKSGPAEPRYVLPLQTV